MERLSRELERLPYVRKVTSVADYVKRVNQQLDGRRCRRVSTARRRAEAIAQELFVFGLSDEGRDELSRVVASDYSRAHISVKLASMSSDLVFEQIQQAEQLAAAGVRRERHHADRHRFGPAVLDARSLPRVSQLSSFGTAFVTVFAVIFLVFRSARFGVARDRRQRVPGRSWCSASWAGSTSR